MSMCSVQNNAVAGWRSHPSMLFDGKENSGIWLGYTVYMHGICQLYLSFGLIDLSVQRNWWNCNHESELACTDHFQGGGHEIIPQNAVLFSMNIWQVYTRHIPSIYMSYLFCCHLAGLPGLPSAPGCLWPGLSADPFRFGYWKSSDSRLGPAKVPQPVVGLIYMAAPAWCRALAVSTSIYWKNMTSIWQTFERNMTDLLQE